MIRTDAEYKRSLQRLEEAKAHYHAQQATFQEQGVPEDAARFALDATYTFLLSVQEDVEAYERAKRGELIPLSSLSDIGRWLVHARVAHGLTQKQLAERLGVSEAQVSRDERNEYHGVSVDRAQTILDRMGVRFRIEEVSASPPAPTEPYTIAGATPPPPPPSAPPVIGYFRAKKNMSPQKAEEIRRVLSAVYESMAGDDAPDLGAQ